MRFLYPTDQGYPIDETCREIIQALELRNWETPSGIEVRFHTYGTGEHKYAKVQELSGDGFRLVFERAQGLIEGDTIDTAGINRLLIPGFTLQLEQGKPPKLYVNVGPALEDGHGRLYVGAKDRAWIEALQTRPLRPDATFTFLTDLGLGRDDPSDIPRVINAREIFGRFKTFLKTQLLKPIQATPPALQRIDRFAPQPIVPFPRDIGPLFCFANWRDVKRVAQGQTKPGALKPKERYALQAIRRLVPLGSTQGMEAIPAIAHDGFIFCGLGTGQGPDPEIPLFSPSLDDDQILRVVPKDAREVYVVETEGHRDWRHFWLQCSVARTLTPIQEYRGDFKAPVVVIRRELGLDEVELIQQTTQQAQV